MNFSPTTTSYPAMDREGMVEETYFHQVELAHKKSWYENRSTIKGKLPKRMRELREDDVIKFSFNKGHLLPQVPHEFEFNLSNILNGRPGVLKENFTQSPGAREKNICVASVKVSFRKKTTILKSEPIHSFLSNPSAELDVPPPSITEWSFNPRSPFSTYWEEDTDYVLINVHVVQCWKTGSVQVTECAYIPEPIITEPPPGFAQYFLNVDKSDVKVACDGTVFPAHTFVLGTYQVFEKMLSPKFKEGQERVITITDMNKVVMKVFLEFLYCGVRNKNDIKLHAKELLQVADKYFIEDLRNYCEHVLAETIETKNTIELYRIGKAFNTPKLMKVAELFFKLHRKEILTSENEFRNAVKEFPDLVFNAWSI